MDDICYVYWLHRPCHSDMMSEGYIGISINPDKRFKSHIKEAGRSSSKQHALYNAMRKYDDFIFTIICKSDKEYCYELERKLRPTKNIGLNHAAGGLIISDERLNYSFNQDIRKKISEGVKRANAENPDIVERQRMAKLGKTLSDLHKRKIGASHKGKQLAWENANANHVMWKNALEIYDYYLEHPNITYYSLSKHFNFSRTTCKGILEMFNNSWNPYKDEKYLNYLRK